MALAALEERLGHSFADPELLRRALSHRSWVAESSGESHSNERLEFLGDAVLGWVIADLSFRRYADEAEGTLTDLRKSVVNARALADVATGLGLPTDFAVQILEQVGNYQEIYDAHITPIGLSLDGSPNNLWTEGGLMYVPPFR